MTIWRLRDYLFVRSVREQTGNRRTARPVIGSRSFYRSARSLPNSIEFQGRSASENACADYFSERGWPGGFNCSACVDGFAEPKPCRTISHVACKKNSTVSAAEYVA